MASLSKRSGHRHCIVSSVNESRACGWTDHGFIDGLIDCRQVMWTVNVDSGEASCEMNGGDNHTLCSLRVCPHQSSPYGVIIVITRERF